jgi:4-hydroxy-tetrahydrodipicolinate synthase
MIEAIYAEEDERAMELDELILPLNEALFSEPSPMPLKAALNEHWGSVGSPRLPLVEATAETYERVRVALDAVAEYRST